MSERDLTQPQTYTFIGPRACQVLGIDLGTKTITFPPGTTLHDGQFRLPSQSTLREYEYKDGEETRFILVSEVISLVDRGRVQL